MVAVPQGVNLQEIQRAFLDLETSLVRRFGNGEAGGVTVSRSRGGVSNPAKVGHTPGGSVPQGGQGGSHISVQTLRLQVVQIDPADGLPLADADDCATVEIVDVPILINPMTEHRLTSPPAGGTYAYSLPSNMDETKSFIHVMGKHLQPLRVETVMQGKRVIFYNGSHEESASKAVTIALYGASPADPGVSIPEDHLAWIQEKDDNSGLELVLYYE
jgi:hypothetical protein